MKIVSVCVLVLVAACSGGGSTTTASGGGGGGSISSSSYSKTCSVDTDCRAVVEGSVCALCSCANAAVAQSDAERYASDRAELAESCGARPTVACEPCARLAAHCDQGTCALGDRIQDAGRD